MSPVHFGLKTYTGATGAVETTGGRDDKGGRTMSGKLHQMIIDVFEKHNPAQLDCISIYRPIVTDLLRHWSYSDDEGDVKCYINDLMIFHLKTFKFELSEHFVAEVYGLRGNMR